MAFNQSNIGGQAPIICSLCENEKAVIKWKCLDCGLFMCNDCKNRKHSKIRNSSDHKVMDISEVGQHTEELDFTTIKCQELSRVDEVCANPDGSLWIRCVSDNLLQKVIPEKNNIKVVSNSYIKVYSMAVTASNDLLLAMEGSRIKQIDCTNGELKDSIYDVTPFEPTAIHVTRDKKVVVGCAIPKIKRCSLIVINENGDHETVYEHDQHHQTLFSYPKKITSTSNGNIHVVDSIKREERGKVVILPKAGGEIINYIGNPNINEKKIFKPAGIETTPSDNIIVVDKMKKTFHIISAAGKFITFYKTSNIGLFCPFSLAFTPTQQFYIGCTRTVSSTAKEAQLYEVSIKGC